MKKLLPNLFLLFLVLSLFIMIFATYKEAIKFNQNLEIYRNNRLRADPSIIEI